MGKSHSFIREFNQRNPLHRTIGKMVELTDQLQPPDLIEALACTMATTAIKKARDGNDARRLLLWLSEVAEDIAAEMPKRRTELEKQATHPREINTLSDRHS